MVSRPCLDVAGVCDIVVLVRLTVAPCKLDDLPAVPGGVRSAWRSRRCYNSSTALGPRLR